MKRLLVYADLDWLDEPTLVGELGYESLRGSDSYSFEYDRAWLEKYGDLYLSADLNNYLGRQYTAEGRDLFGCFADALPDRWGRLLLNRREQIHAQEEQRPIRRLSSYDYLVSIDDFSRMGGMRLKERPEGEFINSSPTLQVPPLTELRALETSSWEVERSEQANQLPEKRWIEQLVQPGSALGGARPKASVTDVDGTLYVAKFPSRSDDYDVGLWEHICYELATEAGINAARTRVLQAGGSHHTLLSRRFDRTDDQRRVHFASAMTLLGLVDGDSAATGCGYLDIVDFILRHCTDVEQNLQEIYRRVAFSIAIGNSDDHFRNHGFLLTRSGWTLSPAYDLNPTLSRYQSLLINSSTSEANLDILARSHGEYMLAEGVAIQIISEVKDALTGWEDRARRLGIPAREISLFADRWKIS